MSGFHVGHTLTLLCGILFIPASTIAIALRFYTRRKQGVRLSWDDWTIIPAWLFVLGLQVVLTIDVALKRLGYPDPYASNGPEGARPNMGFWPFEILDILAIGFTKISVLLFFSRLFGKNSRWLHIASTVLITICIAWTTAFFLVWIFICGGHPDRYWQSGKIEKASCVKTQDLHDAFAISDVVLDVFVVVLPIPSLWALSMSMKKKFLLTGVFSLAGLTLAASIVRLVIMINSVRNRYNSHMDLEDLITSVVYWGMIEAGIGFITANLIVIHGTVTAQLYTKAKNSCSTLAKTVFSSRSSRSSANTGSDSGITQKYQKRVDFVPEDTSSEPAESRPTYLYRKQGRHDPSLDDSFCRDVESMPR